MDSGELIMAYVDYNGSKVYYERCGAGEPLVMLNGIMMSTKSWAPFMDVLKANFDVILVDLLDQGQSDRREGTYTQTLQVEVLVRLIEDLKLDAIHLLGISYGGEVAIQLASQTKVKLKSLVLANTTAYTDPALKTIGDSWISAAGTYDGDVFFKTTLPSIYSRGFYEKADRWIEDRIEMFKKALDRGWYEAFIRLVRSAESYDMRRQLSEIDTNTMIISADQDYITPAAMQYELHRKIKNSKLVEIKNCGHASMYEKPHEFISVILGFLKSSEYEIDIL